MVKRDNEELAEWISEYYLGRDCSCEQDKKCQVCSLGDEIKSQLDKKDKEKEALEKEVAALKFNLEWNEKERKSAHETISRVWEALGIKSYEAEKGKCIWDLVKELRSPSHLPEMVKAREALIEAARALSRNAELLGKFMWNRDDFSR